MTTAIVHDFLTQRGGAERVVLHIAGLVRDPVIVTSLYAPGGTYPEFKKFPVWADQLVAERDAERFRRRAFSYGRAFRDKDLSFADAVIVSSSSFAHHVRTDRALIYWHTPPRFLYDPGAYFPRRSMAKAFELATTPSRRQDRKAAIAHHKHLANSGRTAGHLRSAYGFDADVLYPPFDASRFNGPATSYVGSPKALVVSRLLPYKRVDIAMAACAQAGIPLTIIGQGPDAPRLRSLAQGSVTFLPRVTDDELVHAYDTHSLVLAPGIEDFGFIPLEAASRGRPVVAAREGGAAETVTEKATGLLVSGSDPDVWAAAIRQAVQKEWHIDVMRRSVSRFDAKNFDAGLVRGMCAGGDDDLIECFDLSNCTTAAQEPLASAGY